MPLLGGCSDSSSDDDELVTGTSALVAGSGQQVSGSAQRAGDLDPGPFELMSISVAHTAVR